MKIWTYTDSQGEKFFSSEIEARTTHDHDDDAVSKPKMLEFKNSKQLAAYLNVMLGGG